MICFQVSPLFLGKIAESNYGLFFLWENHSIFFCWCSRVFHVWEKAFTKFQHILKGWLTHKSIYSLIGGKLNQNKRWWIKILQYCKWRRKRRHSILDIFLWATKRHDFVVHPDSGDSWWRFRWKICTRSLSLVSAIEAWDLNYLPHLSWSFSILPVLPHVRWCISPSSKILPLI